jgi:hypothetical protein
VVVTYLLLVRFGTPGLPRRLPGDLGIVPAFRSTGAARTAAIMGFH